MRLRLVAPVLLVLAVTAGGFVAARMLAERDAQQDAEHRAEIAAAEVRGGVQQASNLVESLRRYLLGRVGAGVTNDEFADIGARWLSPVGLPAAAWLERVPEPGAPRVSLRATLVTGADPMTTPGIDLSGEAAVAAAVADPQALFRVTATPLAHLPDGRRGIFLVQSAPRLSSGVLQPGFVMLFVPGSWLLAEVSEETNPRLQLRVGDTSIGDRGIAAAIGSTFPAAGRRFEVLVPKEPIRGAAALLPWLILGAGLVLAALAGTLAAISQRRARAQREVDRIFRLSPDVIAVVGFDGFLKRVNPVFEALFGYTEREARARPYLEFVHPDDRERSTEETGRVVGGEATASFVNRIVCKDGSYRWIEWNTTAVPEERVLYGLARDVTERRRTASEQAALRRVATLAAAGVRPEHLFAVVAEEVARVVDVPLVRVVRYGPDDTATECASFPTEGPNVPFPTRSSLEGMSVLRLVRERSAAARLDDYSGLEGEIAEIARSWGIRSAVGSPITVAGRLWGAVVASSTEQLPEGTEARLADFTELLATAIANAESREALAELAGEQAALRRVAVLVARQASPDAILTAVTEAVGRLLGADLAAMHIFPGDGTATAIAGWSSTGPMLPIGTRLPLENDSATARIFHTGAPARFDSYVDVEGTTAEIARDLRLRSTVGAPILVDGRLWGALMAATRGVEPLPGDAETRIAAFTELVATAISNAQAREDLHQLAEEQAALRRVATLVAHRAPSEELFAAVTTELGQLLPVTSAAMGRYDPDGTFTTVAAWTTTVAAFPVGLQSIPGGKNIMTLVLETGRHARMDTFADASGPVGVTAREAGYRSAVGTPITVEGRLWGVMTAASTAEQPLPSDTEARLASFTELVATAIANADSRFELAASRRRIVAATDEARRRIERDLHDGTQQRLVSLSLALRAAEADVPPDRGDLRSELSSIAASLADAVADLQELSRGIHPAILSEGGLRPALRTLARRSAIPVELDVRTDTRLPEPVEVAAYFVVSEALANAAKHAQASGIEVSLAARNGSLVLSIRDDGVGGADPTRGSGLVGLTDRVEALGGSIQVRSDAGNGTQITAELPLELATDAGSRSA